MNILSIRHDFQVQHLPPVLAPPHLSPVPATKGMWLMFTAGIVSLAVQYACNRYKLLRLLDTRCILGRGRDGSADLPRRFLSYR